MEQAYQEDETILYKLKDEMIVWGRGGARWSWRDEEVWRVDGMGWDGTG